MYLRKDSLKVERLLSCQGGVLSPEDAEDAEALRERSEWAGTREASPPALEGPILMHIV